MWRSAFPFAPGAGVRESTRRAIVCARVLAIFFMMYVHAWAGEVELPQQAFTGPFQLFAAILVDVLGRSSVPMLTIISGFLLVRVSADRKNWPQMVAGKVRSLLVPLYLWNGLFVLLLGAALLLGHSPPSYVEGRPLQDILFALGGRPATIPLAFLRDLFVCALLSPLLVWLVRRALWPTLAAALLFAVLKPDQVLLLRHQILLFYLLGLAFAMRWPVPSGREAPATHALAAAAVGAWLFVLHRGGAHIPPEVEQLLANLSRIGIAWLVWGLCLRLQAGRAYPLLAQVEPLIFLAFCSHFITFRLLGQLAGPQPQLLPLLFLLQPLLALLIAAAVALLLRPHAPLLLKALNGGRLPDFRLPGGPPSPGPPATAADQAGLVFRPAARLQGPHERALPD